MIGGKAATEKEYEFFANYVVRNQKRLIKVFGNLSLESLTKEAFKVFETLDRSYTGHLSEFNYEGNPDKPEFELGFVSYTKLDNNFYSVKLSEYGRDKLNELRKARDQKPIS